jgi:hypothetical protein
MPRDERADRRARRAHGAVEREIGRIDEVRKEAVDIERRRGGVLRIEECRDGGAIGAHDVMANRFAGRVLSACARVAT